VKTSASNAVRVIETGEVENNTLQVGFNLAVIVLVAVLETPL
jgi:hypothetical protein